MNTGELEALLSRLLGNLFCGVWASDEIKTLQIISLPAFYIINTHPRHLPGEHRLAITVEEGGKATFFDSFGFSPDFDYLKASCFLENQRGIKSIFYHNRQLQHALSVVCGQHCLYYLCKRACNLSYKDVLYHYTDNVIKNGV